MDRDMVVVDNFFINSEEDFYNKYDRIKEVCNRENARAYFRVNKRNYKKVALQTLKKVTDNIISENYEAVKNSFLSAAGECHSEPEKRWIVDIDTRDKQFIDEVLDLIHDLHIEISQPHGVIATIPTAAGFHIICKPFNLQRFRMFYPNLDVHKDNPTLLYKP
jgi:hypothetical protein